MTPPIHVSRVYSNLKGGLSADLGPKTLLLGPSASGKSSLIESIELHFGLGVSGYQGRETVKLERWLKNMVADGAEPDTEVICEPEHKGEVRLLYREAAAALAKQPVPALAALVGLAAPDNTREESGALKDLDTARRVIGQFWDDIQRGLPDAKFLKWYADARNTTAREFDKAKTVRTRELAALWSEAAPLAKKLAARAAAYVPKQLGELVLNVGTRKDPRCTLGLKRDGVTRWGLSGFEWNCGLTALACAMANPEQLCLVIPEDRAVDADALSRWLDCLTPAPCQVIVATPTRPATINPRWVVWSPT